MAENFHSILGEKIIESIRREVIISPERVLINRNIHVPRLAVRIAIEEIAGHLNFLYNPNKPSTGRTATLRDTNWKISIGDIALLTNIGPIPGIFGHENNPSFWSEEYTSHWLFYQPAAGGFKRVVLGVMSTEVKGKDGYFSEIIILAKRQKQQLANLVFLPAVSNTFEETTRVLAGFILREDKELFTSGSELVKLNKDMITEFNNTLFKYF